VRHTRQQRPQGAELFVLIQGLALPDKFRFGALARRQIDHAAQNRLGPLVNDALGHHGNRDGGTVRFAQGKFVRLNRALVAQLLVQPLPRRGIGVQVFHPCAHQVGDRKADEPGQTGTDIEPTRLLHADNPHRHGIGLGDAAEPLCALSQGLQTLPRFASRCAFGMFHLVGPQLALLIMRLPQCRRQSSVGACPVGALAREFLFKRFVLPEHVLHFRASERAVRR
jgi:hypothetical protein